MTQQQWPSVIISGVTLDKNHLNYLPANEDRNYILDPSASGIDDSGNIRPTGNFDVINEREEMTTRNFDNISNYYTAALMRLRGRITATVEGLTAVFDSLQKASESLLLRHRDDGVSGQIISYAINSISIDPVFHDVVNCHMDLELPHMANRIELYLQVLAETSAVGTVLSAPTTFVGSGTTRAW